LVSTRTTDFISTACRYARHWLHDRKYPLFIVLRAFDKHYDYVDAPRILIPQDRRHAIRNFFLVQIQ
jgi:hypothetical protein